MLVSTILSISFLLTLVVIFFQERKRLELEELLGEHGVHLYPLMRDMDQAQREIRALNEGHHDLFKLLDTSVSIDVRTHHDCGWLIFIAKVNGKDMVKIQHLRPDMSMKDYRDLVERLYYDCRHVAYIDGPQYCEEFLRPTGKGRRR